MDLKGKVAWITGGTSGIGKATTLLMSRAGAKVAPLGLKQEKLDAVTAQIEKEGGEVLPLKANLRNPEEVERAAQAVVDKWGEIDIVVANAGINGTWAPLEDLSVEEWDLTQEVNLRGTFLTLKYAVPHMQKKGGSIVIVSSVNGTRMFSNTGASAYATSKAGQVALAKMVALEFAEDKIRVNVICPGAIDTSIEDNTEHRDLDEVQVPVEFPEGQIPLTGGKPGTSKQVAELIAFLCSEQASHITGSEMWIDGGQSLLQG
ncbi:MAG: SDR family NAD(P)-dependent oxidoreductase [Pirellulaceae bacterium]